MYENYIDGKVIIINAKEGEEYYFECIRRNINNKIKQACENFQRTVEINFYVPKDIKEELEGLGYKLVTNFRDNKQNVLSW